VTTQLPNVVVYVDENGAPYSTSTEGQAAATSAAAAVVASSAPAYTEAASSSTEIYVAPTPTTLASVYNKAATSSKDSTTQAPAYSSPAAYSSAASSSTSSSKAAASSPAASNGSGPQGYGIVYSPYTDGGDCKSQDQVNSDFAKIMSYASANGDSYDFVRLYGADCNQISLVLPSCEKYDLQIFAGLFNVQGPKYTKEISDLIDQAKDNWSRINTISVGNEIVNNGVVAAELVAGIVSGARATLNAAGYSGKIVAVDTAVAMVAHADKLCGVSDYVAVNAHPFFDGNVAAENSGNWLLSTMQEVSSACGGKDDVWVTETGWPTQGSSNGKAVPSVQNQKAALSSMKSSVSSNVIWFTAFNDMWKANTAATFNAEQYWGMCN